MRYAETILTLSETGPHCRTCGAPQRTPLWPGLQSSWYLQAGCLTLCGIHLNGLK